MELRHLRYFKAVAELLNFSRAAELLHVAQPALSRQIQALEAEIGTQLLDRNRVRVQLTEAGRIFHTHTCKILAQVDIAVTTAQAAGDGTVGELALCLDWRLGSQLVPATIAEFRRTHPATNVSLQDTRAHEQLVLLRSRRAHLGFIAGNFLGNSNEFDSFLTLRSPLYAVLPETHPLARQKTLRMAALANDTWVRIADKEAPGFRAFLTQQCRLSGYQPRFGKMATTPEALFGLVASGYGITLTLEHLRPQSGLQLRCLPTDCEPVEMFAVWRRHEKSPLLHEFLTLLRRQVSAADRPGKTAAPSDTAKA